MRRAWFSLMLAAAAGPAWAQPDLFSRETVSGLMDLRVAGADGEMSWTAGGFGKGRYGDEGTAELAEAALVWRPRLSWSTSGYLALQHQPEQEAAVDVMEAYAAWKPAPRSAGRVSARAGLFWPPISLEHDDLAWGVRRSITPSAINSWVGEEIKVMGGELRAERAAGGHQLAATVAVFGWNDTSGTLLSFRGWALHDVKTTAGSAFPLPPLSPFMQPRQAPITNPTLEIDGRPGWYARADWATPGPVSLNAVYYENRGDPTAVEDLQWGWDTRFWNLGFRAEAGGVEVLAQALVGDTLMGFPTGRGLWVDVGYRSAFVLASRKVGPGKATARLDGFETDDRSIRELDDNTESGWALTGAYRLPLNPNTALMAEVLHVDSERPARGLAAEEPRQTQTTVQTGLRLSF